MKLELLPSVWGQWQALRDATDTEIGCWGIAGMADKPFVVTELVVPVQTCTAGSVEVEPDEQAAWLLRAWEVRKLPPAQSVRIWLHTHPGNSAKPSGTDEEYWRTCEQAQQHGAVMAMLARGGDTYARVRLVDSVYGPFDREIPVGIYLAGMREVCAAKIKRPAPVVASFQWRDRRDGALVPLHAVTKGNGRPHGVTKAQWARMQAEAKFEKYLKAGGAVAGEGSK